jgi:3-oxoadipate enol-lactonase
MDRAALPDGILLEYELSGSGAPIALIHGALLADEWGTLLAEPALLGLRAIAYRRRGYGNSSQPERPLTIDEQASDCARLLRFLGVERCHVVGHSFGGAVALQLAVDSPDLVQSLALLEPALMIGKTAASYRESLERGIDRYKQGNREQLVDGFLEARWPGYSAPLEAAIPGAFTQAVAGAAPTFELDLPGLLGWSFAEAEARALGVPVISVLGSESDRLWSRFGEVHQWILDNIPNAESFVLPNAHHFLHIENPTAMAEALASFFRRHPLVG